ncbi:MAG: hypothetical protein AB7I19_18145, partial [Planctomycetota bacterium]
SITGSVLVHGIRTRNPRRFPRSRSSVTHVPGHECHPCTRVGPYASFLHPGDPITLPIGDVWLDPALIVHVGNTAVDPNRRASLTTTIPTWINPGEVLVYQALALSPRQSFELSPPGFAVVR